VKVAQPTPESPREPDSPAFLSNKTLSPVKEGEMSFSDADISFDASAPKTGDSVPKVDYIKAWKPRDWSDVSSKKTKAVSASTPAVAMPKSVSAGAGDGTVEFNLKSTSQLPEDDSNDTVSFKPNAAAATNEQDTVSFKQSSSGQVFSLFS
jgi:hypothetical protein